MLTPEPSEYKELTHEQFQALQTELMKEFGDEGHDIGDSADFTELLDNTCTVHNAHDSYTVPLMLERIAAYLRKIGW